VGQPFFILSSFASLLLAFTQSSWAQEAPAREKIRQTIRTTREVLKHGLHTHYDVNQSFHRKDCGFALVHIGGSAGDRLLPFWHGEHAMQDGKFYHRTGGSREFTAKEESTMFDGATYYSQTPKARVVLVYREGIFPVQMTPAELLYMELIGYESPRAVERVPTLRGIGNPHPFDLLDVLSDDSYSIRFAEPMSDIKIIVLEKPGVERIWLDEDRGFAVVKRQRNWNDSDVPMMMIENSEFVELADGVWLPRASEIKYYAPPKTVCSGQVAIIAKLTMRELSLSPPNSLFVPNMDGVVQAIDFTLVEGEENKYRTKHVNIVDEMVGQNLAEFVRITPESLGPNPHNSTLGILGGSRLKRWVLLANLVVVIVIAAILYLRHRKAAL
jgi:hypothetical protein